MVSLDYSNCTRPPVTINIAICMPVDQRLIETVFRKQSDKTEPPNFLINKDTIFVFDNDPAAFITIARLFPIRYAILLKYPNLTKQHLHDAVPYPCNLKKVLTLGCPKIRKSDETHINNIANLRWLEKTWLKKVQNAAKKLP